jgi:hypothetical protein
MTYHSVLREFVPFFGGELASFSQQQIHALSALVNAAVKEDGPLENAFSTALLEHLHQIRAEHALRPHLSKTAREKTRA